MGRTRGVRGADVGAGNSLVRRTEAGEQRRCPIHASGHSHRHRGAPRHDLRPGSLAVVAVGLPLAILEVWRHRTMRRAWLAASVILLASAAPPYAIAWAKTGNPSFPFFNQLFHSPLLASQFVLRDARFHEPLTWH